LEVAVVFDDVGVIVGFVLVLREHATVW